MSIIVIFQFAWIRTSVLVINLIIDSLVGRYNKIFLRFIFFYIPKINVFWGFSFFAEYSITKIGNRYSDLQPSTRLTGYSLPSLVKTRICINAISNCIQIVINLKLYKAIYYKLSKKILKCVSSIILIWPLIHGLWINTAWVIYCTWLYKTWYSFSTIFTDLLKISDFDHTQNTSKVK